MPTKLPLMVTVLIVTTTILMFLAFGSVVLPIKAALMSALTLGSTMGILTWMFVEGHGSGLMNYTPQPLMAPMIAVAVTLFVAGLPFGKAMGWGAQVRDTRALPLGLCVSRLWPQMLFGFAGFAWAAVFAPSLVWPLLPVILGPAIAVPLALGTSGEWVGRLALATRLWRLPEETVPPECLLPLRLSLGALLAALTTRERITVRVDASLHALKARHLVLARLHGDRGVGTGSNGGNVDLPHLACGLGLSVARRARLLHLLLALRLELRQRGLARRLILLQRTWLSATRFVVAWSNPIQTQDLHRSGRPHQNPQSPLWLQSK